jgi:hypothetical protein
LRVRLRTLKKWSVDLYYEARTLLEDIIDHIPAGELRASFVALPELKKLLARSRRNKLNCIIARWL